MRYAGFGIQLAVTLLVFAWIGHWADDKLGTKGVITILAVLVGFGAMLYSLIRGLNRKDNGDR
jgi:hypothetical protein